MYKGFKESLRVRMGDCFRCYFALLLSMALLHFSNCAIQQQRGSFPTHGAKKIKHSSLKHLPGLRLRGGHEDCLEDAHNPDAWHEGQTCEEYQHATSLLRNVKPGSEHAPWVDVRRQAYIEMKAHNRSEMLALQNSGSGPPRVPLVWYGTKGTRQPICETWEQYWEQWVRIVAGPLIYSLNGPHVYIMCTQWSV
jgi:hypothetical protein